MDASIAPSIRWKATRLPPESTTATFIFQFRFFASATAASISDWARSSDIGGPYGVSKGILSGTQSRGFVSVGCSARLALVALPVFSFDIRPPSKVFHLGNLPQRINVPDPHPSGTLCPAYGW